jgi:hypothetical protein
VEELASPLAGQEQRGDALLVFVIDESYNVILAK